MATRIGNTTLARGSRVRVPQPDGSIAYLEWANRIDTPMQDIFGQNLAERYNDFLRGVCDFPL